MEGSPRWVGVVAIGIVCFIALFIIGGGVSFYLAMEGKWPFPPLNVIAKTVKLENRGTVEIKGLEDRGFGSDGYLFQAQYFPPGKTEAEKIGDWTGYEPLPKTFLANELVLVVEPGGKKLHVRGADGLWKWFVMLFPGESSSLPLSHFTSMTSLPEEALRKIREGLTSEEKKYSPNTTIKDFDPQTSELTVSYLTAPESEKTLHLKLDPTGKRLSLMKIGGSGEVDKNS